MMFFLPRVNPLIALALVTGSILALVLDLEQIVFALSGLACVFLVLSVLFNLYEGPKR
jgi:hypothetical protein